MVNELFNGIGDELADLSLGGKVRVCDVVYNLAVQSVGFYRHVLTHDLKRNLEKGSNHWYFRKDAFPHRSIHHRLVCCVEGSEGSLEDVRGHEPVGEKVTDDHLVELVVVLSLLFISDLFNLFVDSVNGADFLCDPFDFSSEFIYLIFYSRFKGVDSFIDSLQPGSQLFDFLLHLKTLFIPSIHFLLLFFLSCSTNLLNGDLLVFIFELPKRLSDIFSSPLPGLLLKDLNILLEGLILFDNFSNVLQITSAHTIVYRQ
jgi:hypothetical protein